MNSLPANARAQKMKMLRSLFLGGILPVIAFSVIEDRFGTLWGLIAGMVFGLGEILWEWRTLRKVEVITWGGNGMILVLGGISLLTQDGIWFKLQPAIIEAAMAFALVGSVALGKPLLVPLMEKAMKQQGAVLDFSARAMAPQEAPIHRIFIAIRGLTLRMGIFFAFHAVLATWAALHWSTAAWAILKGVGFTGSMVVYMGLEAVLLRRKVSGR